MSCGSKDYKIEMRLSTQEGKCVWVLSKDYNGRWYVVDSGCRKYPEAAWQDALEKYVDNIVSDKNESEF